MADIFWMEEAFQHLEEKRAKYDAETDKQVKEIACSSWPAERYLREILIELIKIRRREERP